MTNEHDIGIKIMEKFFEQYVELCDEYDEASARKTELYKKVTDLENQAMEYLASLGLDKYSSKHGTASFKAERSFLTPKTPEDKDLFAKFLKSRGMYEQMVTYNANSINALCRREVAEDPTTVIPGIKEGEPVKKFYFRRAK